MEQADTVLQRFAKAGKERANVEIKFPISVLLDVPINNPLFIIVSNFYGSTRSETV